MPCYDDRSERDSVAQTASHVRDLAALQTKLDIAEAIACSLVRANVDGLVDDVDNAVEVADVLDEAGVFDEESGLTPKEFIKFWKAHVQKDNARRKAESEAKLKKEKAKYRAALLAKVDAELNKINSPKELGVALRTKLPTVWTNYKEPLQ